MEHYSAKRCSFCGSTDLHVVCDFGNVALAGAFLKKDELQQEKKYRLRLSFCSECKAVQLIDIIAPKLLFSSYFYFSSSIHTLVEHFASLAQDVTTRFLNTPTQGVLEFGCNDGVFLNPLSQLGVSKLVGVDPAANVIGSKMDSEVTFINDFFTLDVATKIRAQHGLFKVVVANNVFAHIPDIENSTRAVETLLEDDGVFIFEVHHLSKVIAELQYDMIYHEHVYYHSYISLEKFFKKFDLMIFDVEEIPIHAGSNRFYVCRKGSVYSQVISHRVERLATLEYDAGYDRLETFVDFAGRIELRKDKLLSTIKKIKNDGGNVVGYGASGRANTIIQYCGLDHSHIDFVVDDAEAKIGHYMPGSHFEIKSSKELQKQPAPTHALLFAWSFREEVIRRNQEFIDRGGKFIIPLPEVIIIP